MPQGAGSFLLGSAASHEGGQSKTLQGASEWPAALPKYTKVPPPPWGPQKPTLGEYFLTFLIFQKRYTINAFSSFLTPYLRKIISWSQIRGPYNKAEVIPKNSHLHTQIIAGHWLGVSCVALHSGETSGGVGKSCSRASATESQMPPDRCSRTNSHHCLSIEFVISHVLCLLDYWFICLFSL